MLHREVREAVLSCGRGKTGDVNAKGDDVRAFDLAADDAAIAVLERSSLPLVIDSEEVGRREIGSGPPGHRVVLDPVDGSDNWSRQLPLSAVSCAVLPIDAALHPESVEAAIVGPLAQEMPVLAQKGSGAWSGGVRLETSGVGHLADAVISIELNHFAPPPHLVNLMADARGVRSYGCASRALALVAAGAIDAHLDMRGRLTAESYLAGARLVIEAGGCVAGLDGGKLPAAHDLTDGIGLIAAASQGLCDEIVERLGDGGS
jgi:myo-inositol-1(or 4)-monophosphatase